MRKLVSVLLLLLLFVSCKNSQTDADSNKNDSVYTKNDSLANDFFVSDSFDYDNNSIGDTTTVNMLFSEKEKLSELHAKLITETGFCNPSPENDKTSVPCNAELFRIYPYNHNRKIEDAFILMIKAGVKGFAYRRLIIYVRQNDQLVVMNEVVGYLVKRIAQPSGVDDLIVAVFDDLGNNNFSRYDVLLKYKNGKYHFVEALGDLQGKFENPDLKKRATKAIHKRIQEDKLIL